MKRTLILLTTAAMLAASPAFAWTTEQEDAAYGAAGVIAFDKTCEKVSPQVMDAALRARASVPDAAYSEAAMGLFDSFLKSIAQAGDRAAGKAAWCAKVKSIISNG
jgi:hypothetical protein